MTVKVKWKAVLSVDPPVPLLRWIDLGNGTMFRIAAFFVRGGVLDPGHGIYVGIERVGGFFFKWRGGNTPFAWNYVAEKLNLPESDARNLADWINAQFIMYQLQQGEYVEDYINAVEPYHYSGERAIMPLVPEIIKGDVT